MNYVDNYAGDLYKLGKDSTKPRNNYDTQWWLNVLVNAKSGLNFLFGNEIEKDPFYTPMQRPRSRSCM